MSDEKNPIQQMVEAGMILLEMMNPILDTLAGYQKECIGRGYTEEEARKMATDLHYMMTHISAPKE